MADDALDTGAQENTAGAGGAVENGAAAAEQAQAAEAGKQTEQAKTGSDSLLDDQPEGDQPGEKPEDDKGEEAEGDKITAESYGDFEVPEGITVNEPLLNEFKDTAAKLGLTKDKAQELINLQIKNVQEQMAKWGEVRKGWVGELKADAEFGGEKFDSTVKDAKLALRQFDPDGSFLKALQSSMYDNNPATLKFLARVQRAVGEDAVHTSRDQGKNSKPDLTTRLWGDADMGGK